MDLISITLFQEHNTVAQLRTSTQTKSVLDIHPRFCCEFTIWCHLKLLRPAYLDVWLWAILPPAAAIMFIFLNMTLRFSVCNEKDVVEVFSLEKKALTTAFSSLLHGLAPQSRFPIFKCVVDIGDSRNGQVSHGARQVFASFKEIQLLKNNPGNQDNRETNLIWKGSK